MRIFPKNTLHIAEVKKFIIIFYAIGVLGFIFSWSRSFFITITPLALLLSTYLLAIYHNKYTQKDFFLFLVILVFGFFVEVIGVNTGLIFGNYQYGEALGPKLFNTPLLIAFNWLFLTYTATSLSEKISNKIAFQIWMAPTFMLMYDLIIEQFAPKINMWSWKDAVVPLKNYLAWWFIGFLFVCLLKIFRTNTNNPLAVTLLVCQFLFFVVLYIINELFL
jgi:putative membrane protein